MYDPRLARFFAVDPLAGKYPYMTPYQFAGNKFIWSRELEGLQSEVDQKEVEEKSLPSVGEFINDVIDEFMFKSVDEDIPEEVRDDLPNGGKMPSDLPDPRPEAAGVSVGGSFVFGGGGSKTVTLLYIKGEGFAVVGDVGGGLGADVSLSGGAFLAYSDDPKLATFVGEGRKVTGDASIFTASYFEDFDSVTNEYGDNWQGYAFGLSVGPSDLAGPLGIGGTAQVTNTYTIITE